MDDSREEGRENRKGRMAVGREEGWEGDRESREGGMQKQ